MGRETEEILTAIREKRREKRCPCRKWRWKRVFRTVICVIAKAVEIPLKDLPE
jgi:hypothetical protein